MSQVESESQVNPVPENQTADTCPDDQLNAELTYAFPVPILKYRWPESEQLNTRLRKIVLSREKSENGVKISNVGGWHSEKNLHKWPDDAIGTLLERIQAMAREMVRRTVTNPSDAHLYDWDLWAWANINRKGHYNEAHIHYRPYVWSGIYYVDPGKSSPISGLTKFQDKSGVPKEMVQNSNPHEREISIVPEAGLMVLFPVTLWHYADEYQGETPRITIAFDLANPAFSIPRYGNSERHWMWANFPWLMRARKQLKRKLGMKRRMR